MALIQTITTAYELQNIFARMGRDYYTIEGYEAMLNYCDECGDNVELDVIGFCGDFNEESIEYVYDNCSNLDEIEECKNEDGEIDEDALLDALNYYTYAVKLNNGNIFYIAF